MKIEYLPFASYPRADPSDFDQTQATKSQLDNLINNVDLYGKVVKGDPFKPVLSHILELDKLVGTSFAKASDLNLYGFIKQTTDKIALYEVQSAQIMEMLAYIKENPTQDQSTSISKISGEILATNQIPEVSIFFTPSNQDAYSQSNKLLQLLAIINTNKAILVGKVGEIAKHTWLEDGSINFRTVATNTGDSDQKVTIKFYLPPEIKKELIVDQDAGLTITLDSTENAFYATRELTLPAYETRILSVQVEDVWAFSQQDIDKLKTEVDVLTTPPNSTSTNSQTLASKKNIADDLNKILLDQKSAITPENRITTYRLSALEMNGVEEKINSLKKHILQSESGAGLLCFGDGIQTVSLWGIVLILISGFVFLYIYLKALRSEIKEKNGPKQEDKPTSEETGISSPRRYRSKRTQHKGTHKAAKITATVLLAAGIGSISLSSVLSIVKETAVTNEVGSATTVLGASTEKTYPYQSSITVSEGEHITVRNSPTVTAPEIMRIKESQTIHVFKFSDGWVQIGLSPSDEEKGWWINADHLVK